jgi:hypothetical protein
MCSRAPRSLTNLEGRHSSQQSPCPEVSAAWARVTGGSSLSDWYQADRLPRSLDTSMSSMHQNGQKLAAAATAESSNKGQITADTLRFRGAKADEKWAAFAKPGVAEPHFPSLQPQATFLL